MSIVLLLQRMGRCDRHGVVDLQEGVGGGTEGGYYLVVSAFAFFQLCFCPLFSHVLCPFFLSDWTMVAVVSVSLFFISFLCLCSL